jgi:hypothetical protein
MTDRQPVGRPRVLKDRQTRSVVLDGFLIEAVEQHAGQHGLTFSAALRDILNTFLRPMSGG